MRSFIRALGVAAMLAVAALSATAARAGIVFSNLSAGDLGVVTVNSGTNFALRFTTGTSSLAQRQVESIQLRLSVVSGTASPLFSLFTSSGTVPGTVFATFTGPTVASTTPSTYTFTPTSAITLSAATQYYAVLDASTSTPVQWGTMNSEATLQNGSDYLYELARRTTNGGASWSGGPAANAADTASFQITAVPEPSTIVMACIGVSGAVVLDAKRRRRRRATVVSEEATV